MNSLRPAATLPKFLLGEADPAQPETILGYVLHVHEPAMLIEFVQDAATGAVSGSPVQNYFDTAAFIQRHLDAGQEPAMILARIMRQAGDFFRENL